MINRILIILMFILFTIASNGVWACMKDYSLSSDIIYFNYMNGKWILTGFVLLSFVLFFFAYYKWIKILNIIVMFVVLLITFVYFFISPIDPQVEDYKSGVEKNIRRESILETCKQLDISKDECVNKLFLWFAEPGC